MSRACPGSLLAAGLVLAIAGAAACQDLAEAAAREKQRREAVRARGHSRSFSDENLRANQSGWQAFGGEAYGFRALFPAAPRVEDETDIVGAARILRRRYVAAAAGLAYSVLVKARPRAPGLSDDTLLNRLQAEARADLDGEVLDSRRLAGEPCPAVEFSVRAQRAARERFVLQRAFACSKRLFTVAAEYQPIEGEGEGESEPTPPAESAAVQFLDSFVLEES